MKEWIFGTGAGVAGMVMQHKIYAGVGGTNKFRADTTWTSDCRGKPYISATVTTYDLGMPYAASKRVVQDAWGNLKSMKLFDWGATGALPPRRQFTNTYLTTQNSVNYVTAYIRNGLLTTTMSEMGGTPVTL